MVAGPTIHNLELKNKQKFPSNLSNLRLTSVRHFKSLFKAGLDSLLKSSGASVADREAYSSFITIATFYSRKSWQNGLCL